MDNIFNICRRFKAALEVADGITMGHLKENNKGVFSSFNIFGSVPDTDTETLSQAARKADVFFVVNASTVELQDVECYAEETAGQRPLVLWNLELDTLRADLGEPYWPKFEQPCSSPGIHQESRHAIQRCSAVLHLNLSEGIA